MKPSFKVALDVYVMIYMNDLFIFDKTEEGNLQRMKTVLNRIKRKT